MKRTRFPILAAAVTVLCAMTAMAAAAPFDDLDNLGHPVMAFGHDPTELVLDPADVPVEALAIAAAAGNEAAVIMLAHAGQLSPKDGCHNHKAAGERHWHEDGTSDRAGPCVKVNGVTEKMRSNALCLDERLHMTDLIEDYWNTMGDWEDMARALRSCIQGLDPPD